MNIGIIGSGKVGSGLGKIWANKGHRVIFSFSRDPKKLRALAESSPQSRAASPAEAAELSEIVLLSVGWAAAEDAIKAAGSLSGKIIIDCTNPLRSDLSGLSVGLTTSAAEEIAKMAPEAIVVKAFNTVFAEVYHSESRLFGSRRPTMFYCSDNTEAKSAVARLIHETGFEPIDSGPLKSARYLEPLAMLMIQLGRIQNMGTDITLTLIHR